jgi:hypothetical protein
MKTFPTVGSLLLVWTCILAPCGLAWAGPTIEIRLTYKAIEKSHDSYLFLSVKAEEFLTNVLVSPIEPDGFAVDPVPGAGYKIVRADGMDYTNAVRIERLEAGGNLLVPFRIQPPGTFGNRPRGDYKWYERRGKLVSTREVKVFAFNVFGEKWQSTNWVRFQESREAEAPYTTSLGLYLCSGLVGICLGFAIKCATQYRDEMRPKLEAESKIRSKLRVFTKEVFIERTPLLLTLLVVGFAALLMLAREALPVASWHQAVALGIGLGLLSDEELISKIKGK